MNVRISRVSTVALLVACVASSAGCENSQPAPATTPDTTNDLGTLSDVDATKSELPDVPVADVGDTAKPETAADTAAETASEAGIDLSGDAPIDAPPSEVVVDVQPELPPIDVLPEVEPFDAPDIWPQGEVGTSDAGSAPQQHWWEGCGYPVCGPWQQKDGVPDCTTQKPGDPCAAGSPSCDPHGNCNQLYVCAGSDPKAAGCPKSQRAVKSEVRYLTPADVEKVRQQLLATKLATYRYTESGPQGPRHLGFIIDDQPQSPAVAANGERVDLYGYLSMAVATLQVQAKQIERLEQEVARLRNSCSKTAAAR